MLSAHLKAFTGEAHASLEKRIVHELKTISSPKDYYRILSLFYGYYKELENLIAAFLDTGFLPDYHSRRKSAALIQDLASIDESAARPAPALCEDLPRIGTLPQALGAMYVLEGSTLGGPVISRIIAQRIDVPEGGLTFFTGYGADTQRMWSTFVEKLNALDLDSRERQEVLEAARDTFVKFENWVNGYGE